MFRVYFKGGLGNQLFQFAHTFYLADGDINKIIFDISLLKYHSKKNTKRQFQLKFLDIKYESSFLSALRIQIKSRFVKISSDLKIINDNNFTQKFNRSNYDVCGYFQEDLFYLENIKNEFSDYINSKLNKKIFFDAKFLPNQNSASIHIRRGDYINNKFANKVHKSLDIDYYLKAINVFNKKTTVFYIFSDDQEWVERFLLTKVDINYIFASKLGLNDLEEFFLMSKCHNNIISNSTYSWWAAFLNSCNSKIIISPSSWFNDGRVFPRIKNAIYL
jgi:hypothetical protein